MKIIKSLNLSFLVILILLSGCSKKNNNPLNSKFPETIKVTVKNPSNLDLHHQIIAINIDSLKVKHSGFNPNAFVVTRNGNIIPSEAENINSSSMPEKIDFLTDISPEGKNQYVIRYKKSGIIKTKYKKRTQAVLSIKEGYNLINGIYTGGAFVDTDFIKVPALHKVHDSYFRIEGPGWESDKIAYRYYLDSRNRIDIFGKKVNNLVLQNVGRHDLIANSKESYTKMLPWGMDIYKVGESMGVGSFGMWINGKVVTVSKTDSVLCWIADNGPIKSDIYTKYYGWRTGSNVYNLSSELSIAAGSRLTKVDLHINGHPSNLCTGLANHKKTKLLTSNKNNNSSWGFIGVYGQQSLSGDSLGTALFYKKSDLIKFTQDKDSYILILTPNNGHLTYYFAAAWDQEPGGIKNKSQFMAYLKRTSFRLNSKLQVGY